MHESRGLDPRQPTDEPTPAEVWLRNETAIAAFTPSEGLCCTAFRVLEGGEWLKVLAEPPSWSALRARPAFYGNPLLFPYPFGMPDGVFTYRGKQYRVQPGRTGRAAHGFVRDHPWTVDRQWADDEGTHLRAAIASLDVDPELAEFPFPFRFVVTQTLRQTTLTLEFEVTNLGASPMPMGLGIHPYFPVPLRPGGDPNDYVMRSDANSLVASGLDEAAPRNVAPPGALDLRAGQRVPDVLRANPRGDASRSFFAAYTREAASAAGDAPGISWSLVDRAHGVTVEVVGSAAFQVLALFAPAPPTVISPVLSTCLPDAFNLASRGLPSGTIELEPGATWRAWSRITVRSTRP